MSNGSSIDSGLLLAYCRHIRRHIGETSNIPTICRGFSFAVQQSGMHYNLTQMSGMCTINVNGTNNNISYQQPVNEPAATARGGIGEKFPDANDDVAASDCRSIYISHMILFPSILKISRLITRRNISMSTIKFLLRTLM